MAKIHAPNQEYTGVSATVVFVDGIGETEDPALLQWFLDKGYKVEGVDAEDLEEAPQEAIEMDVDEDRLDDMNMKELKAYAKQRGLEGYSQLSKPDLLALIHQANA